MGSNRNLYGDFSNRRKLNELKRTSKCIILPDSRFKIAWNIIIILLLLYTAVFVPFKISFLSGDNKVIEAFEWVSDTLFALDIFVNFCTATENSKTGMLEFSHKKLAFNYIKSWFFLDLLACFPF